MINSQSAIDDFSTNYPGCTNISGTMVITGSDITDLSGLSQIETINGNFEINSTTNLFSLNGLENITSVGGHVSLDNNLRMRNVDALSSASINGLLLTNNPSLGACAISNFCSFLSAPTGTISISGNMRGCASVDISNTCQGLGDVFWTNKNGTNAWSDPLNWSRNVLPSSADNVVIGKDYQGNMNLINMSLVMNSLEFEMGTNVIFYNGVTLNINGDKNGISIRSGASYFEMDGMININNLNSVGFQNLGTLEIMNSGSVNIYGDGTGATGIINDGSAYFNNGGNVLMYTTSTAGTGIQNSGGTFVNTGTLSLDQLFTGIVNSSGGTITNFGSISAEQSLSYGFDNGATFNQNASGSIDIRNSANVGVQNTGSFSGAGGFFTGGSTGLELFNSGTMTYSGEIRGTGDITWQSGKVGSTLSPGNSPGALNFTGSTDFDGATFEMEIAGTNTTDFDRVTVNGSSDFSNTVFNFSTIMGYTALPDETFVVFTASGGITGTPTINLPPEIGGVSWSYEVGSNSISLKTTNALPVELLHFRGDWVGNDILLQWETASEIENRGFEIQWSPDAENWEMIGFVQGAGNSTERLSYSFTDYSPKAFFNYYRLKQIDFDGTETFNDVVFLRSNKKGILALTPYPNPLMGKSFYIKTILDEPGEVFLSINDSQGRLVHNESINLEQGESSTLIQPRIPLSEGVYFLEVTKGTSSQKRRIVVVRE